MSERVGLRGHVKEGVLLVTRGNTVDDINPALPIIRNTSEFP